MDQDKDRWPDLVNAVMNFLVPQNAVNFSTTWGPVELVRKDPDAQTTDSAVVTHFVSRGKFCKIQMAVMNRSALSSDATQFLAAWHRLLSQRLPSTLQTQRQGVVLQTLLWPHSADAYQRRQCLLSAQQCWLEFNMIWNPHGTENYVNCDATQSVPVVLLEE